MSLKEGFFEADKPRFPFGHVNVLALAVPNRSAVVPSLVTVTFAVAHLPRFAFSGFFAASLIDQAP